MRMRDAAGSGGRGFGAGSVGADPTDADRGVDNCDQQDLIIGNGPLVFDSLLELLPLDDDAGDEAFPVLATIGVPRA